MTRMNWGAVMVSGAIYRPFAVIRPRGGSRLQLTVWSCSPVAAAWNCWVCPGASEVIWAGVTATRAGELATSATMAVPWMDRSEGLLALIVTAWGDDTVSGGV